MNNYSKKYSISAMKQWLLSHKWIILLMLPFWLMDWIVRIYGHSIGFYPAYYLGPNLFTFIYLAALVGIIAFLRRPLSNIIYVLVYIVFYIFCATQLIYYSLTNFYFSFSLLQMASEGSSYILDTIKNTPVFVYLILFFLLVVLILCYKVVYGKHQDLFPAQTKHKSIFGMLLLFLLFHGLAPLSLGPGHQTLKWNTFQNPRNVYDSYSDPNKSLRVSGLYEYTFRNFYQTFLKPEDSISSEEEAFLSNAYSSNERNSVHEYTGLFQGKNLILLQLEGLDSWLLTEETTPNLYQLRSHSINFTDHYSYYTGGGSTFNSEFSVNTGFTTPITFEKNAYTLNVNSFPYTLAKLFKEQDYTVNAFHMNSGEFYSRAINYQNWGYDHYYGLADFPGINVYADPVSKLDRTLIEYQPFYEKMFPQGQKFVNYIITYTPHTPFSPDNDVVQKLNQLNNPDRDLETLDEETIAKMDVQETDYMVGLLIQALKDQNLYDNTVIVAFADHYLYSLNDKSILERNKTYYDDNRINETPFFIWSSDCEYQEVTKANMQLHILPTVLNLFGISYNPAWFLGGDILDQNYEEIVFFPDQTWYDGDFYYTPSTNNSDTNEVSSDTVLTQDEIAMKNQTVIDLIQKNDLTLKYDYFR